MAGRKYEVYVQKGRPWYKIVSGILFSHVGLFVLCIIYAVGGQNFPLSFSLFVPPTARACHNEWQCKARRL